MAHKDVQSVVSAVVPCIHMAWPDGSAPELPWAVYTGDTDPFCADDREIARTTRWTVELYERRRDAKLETELANAIRAAFGACARRESWVSSEQCLMVAFDFCEVEGEDGFDG